MFAGPNLPPASRSEPGGPSELARVGCQRPLRARGTIAEAGRYVPSAQRAHAPGVALCTSGQEHDPSHYPLPRGVSITIAVDSGFHFSP